MPPTKRETFLKLSLITRQNQFLPSVPHFSAAEIIRYFWTRVGQILKSGSMNTEVLRAEPLKIF